MRWILFTVLVAVFPAVQADVQSQPYEYPYEVSVYDLPESENGVSYRLYVRKPLRESAEGEMPTAVFVLDALALFPSTAAMSFNLEYFNYLPAMVIVGVGYQDEADNEKKAHNRTRDYTPTAFKPPDKTHFLAHNPVDYEGSGGAPAFFDIVENQVIPLIESRYGTDPNDRVLIGKSLSGLAAVYASLARPALFRRVIAISPAVWWDDWLVPRDRRAIARIADQTSGAAYPDETRLYLAVGTGEERLRLVSDLHVLADQLRQQRRKNFKLTLDVLDGEIHESIFPSAVMRGLRAVYSGDPGRRDSSSPIIWP